MSYVLSRYIICIISLSRVLRLAYYGLHINRLTMCMIISLSRLHEPGADSARDPVHAASEHQLCSRGPRHACSRARPAPNGLLLQRLELP